MSDETKTVLEVMSVDAHASVSSVVSHFCRSSGRRDIDDPFYVVNLGTVIKKFVEWQTRLPRVTPFYAIKCNGDPVLVRLLAALKLNFDCASKTEIKTVLDMGLGPERIIYANPCKQTSHLRFAAQHGISLMTFDNEYELHKVKAIYPTAKLVLRVKVDDSKSICQFNIKFGANPEDAPHLFTVAKDLGLDISGVSFHVGSGCCDAKAFSQAVAVAKGVFDMAIDAGFKPTLLDIGGGFPGTDEAPVSFGEIALELNRALDAYFPEESGVKIIAEPGRFFAAASHTLVTNVASKRLVDWEVSDEMCCDVGDGPIANIRSKKTDTEKAFMYYLNEGVYSSFNCIIFDHIDSPKPMTLERKDGPLYPCSLWGPTCDSMDKINEYCELPELEIGEWVYFEDMGAYTKSAASTFNGYHKAHNYYVVSSGLKSEIQGFLSGVSDSHSAAVTKQVALPQLWQSPPFQIVTLKSSDIQLLSVE